MKSKQMIAMQLNYWTILLIASFLVGFSESCEDDEELEPFSGVNRIVAGREATEGEFPSFVSLAFTNHSDDVIGEVRVCSGTLISKRLVLTAAHCINRKKGHIFVSNSIWHPYFWVENEAIRVKADKVCHSKKYSKFGRFDYGFVRLSQDFPIEESKLAKFPTERTSIGDVGISVGIGFYGEEFGVKRKPEKVQVLKMVQSECRKGVTKQNICFIPKPGFGGICGGDSGGPIYVKQSNGETVVGGIASWADKNCQKSSRINAFVSVFEVLADIKAMAKYCAKED